MCLTPITLPTRKRYILSGYRDSLYDTFSCGHCEECITKNMHEWQLRLYYEHVDTIEKDGFVYYDTLTYSEDNHPFVSHIFPNIDYDCYCFSRDDVRKFFVRLRRYLSVAGYDVSNNLGYFLTSEYGTDERYTHRCHYHILFFVKFKIPAYTFSKFVSKAWFKGRTDGCPFKPYTYVMEHNVIDTINYKVTNYIAKYIRKKSSYQSVIDKRVNYLLNQIPSDLPDSLSQKLRNYIKRELNQFHLQSHFIGIRFLRELSVDNLFASPYVSLPSKDKFINIFLPLYYRRKLFYKSYTNDFGYRTYTLNDLGKRFQTLLAKLTENSMRRYYQSKNADCNTSFDVDSLVEYSLYHRGRYPTGAIPLHSSEERYYSSDLYSYYTPVDCEIMDSKPFVTPTLLGQFPNYDVPHSDRFVKFDFYKYIRSNSYFDPDLEKSLSIFSKSNVETQRLKKSHNDFIDKVRDSSRATLRV